MRWLSAEGVAAREPLSIRITRAAACRRTRCDKASPAVLTLCQPRFTPIGHSVLFPADSCRNVSLEPLAFHLQIIQVLAGYTAGAVTSPETPPKAEQTKE